MSVTATKAPARIFPLKSGTILADGSEQVVVQYTEVGRLVGYIDLQNMGEGDTTIIRQYMKLRAGGDYRKYAEETYSGVQEVPIQYITPKESDYGVRVTLQQTSGAYKSYDFNFLKEK
jgi:hypothetical protein